MQPHSLPVKLPLRTIEVVYSTTTSEIHEIGIIVGKRPAQLANVIGRGPPGRHLDPQDAVAHSRFAYF